MQRQAEGLVVTRFGQRGSTELGTPPAPNEFEISVFGPGIGECVIVHLGDGNWMVVDSCIDAATRRPIALNYLATLGVDISTAVKILVVTHWHDDHMRGAAEVLREATSAVCVCSAALREQEFRELIAASGVARISRLGTAEIASILEILVSRRPAGARELSAGPEWAIQDRRIFSRDNVEVFALSPSSASLTLAMQEIAQMLPSATAAERRLVGQTANQVAVVLWVKMNGMNALLGSDLELSRNPLTGWEAIVSSVSRPDGVAQVFKVPHHGSVTADHPRVWQQLLDKSPCALLTPFTRQQLPSGNDLKRIATRTDRAFCTERSTGWTPRRRSNVVERMTATRKLRALVGPMGHVRLRIPAGDAPRAMNVQLSPGAFHVKR